MAATKTRRPRRVLTPVTITSRYPSFRAGRMENWSAVSADGTWKYERLEISGTPWEAVHVPTGITTDWYGTLTAARAATADGSALACVERIQAHDRGDHKAEHDSSSLMLTDYSDDPGFAILLPERTDDEEGDG
jgi:hypothetical protein